MAGVKASGATGGTPGKRILIVRLSAIGDVVRVLSALEILKRQYPKASIDWVVRQGPHEVLVGHPALHEVLILPKFRPFLRGLFGFAALFAKVWFRRYDLVFDFHATSFLGGLLVFASQARMRCGFERARCSEGSFLFTNVHVPVPRRVNRVHEFHLLSTCLAPDLRAALPPRPDVPVDAQSRNEVEEFLRNSVGGKRPLVVLHPIASKLHKQWPEERFGAVGDLLAERLGAAILLTFGPGQEEAAGAVAAGMRCSPLFLPWPPTLKRLTWALRCANLFVGPDTGPMHLASAMGTPTVAVFVGTGHTAHGPYWGRNAVFVERMVSRNGRSRPTFSWTSPERVFDACRRMLEPVKAFESGPEASWDSPSTFLERSVRRPQS